MPANTLVSQKNGYTIIEILIVIATLTIIFSVGFASFRSAQKRQELTSAVNLVKTDLRRVQELALSNRTKPASCSVLKGYKLKYVNSKSYKTAAYCNSGASTTDIDLPNSTVDWSGTYPNANFQSNFTEVTFLTLGRGVEVNKTITLSVSGVGSQAINITKGGEIN